MNTKFGKYLSNHGILHQTTCRDRAPQNGIAEKMSQHLLEVVGSLMFTMNILKYLYSEAILKLAYLINQMLSRVLDQITLYKILNSDNKYIVSPKVFGCVCFIRDPISTIGKLDPWVVKCVFMGIQQPKRVTSVGVQWNAEVYQYGCDFLNVKAILWRKRGCYFFVQ